MFILHKFEGVVMAGTISVDWECVSDGKTAQGSLFKSNMQGFLRAGYAVRVLLPDGSDGPRFTDADEFGGWFDSIGVID